jgi:phospholipid/cholesterol/gamma-HCH transport system permease protein
MSSLANVKHLPIHFVGRIGRRLFMLLGAIRSGLEHLSGMWSLFLRAIYLSTAGPWTGQTKLARQLFPMMSNVGVRSLPIVSLISGLMGAILVLQTGPTLKMYGQLSALPGMVGLSMVLELGPLMTAIVMTARVGASYTAVLASMKINDEILALETMAIDPVGYLIAPRLLSMLVMVPCLTLFSYLIGMVGGAIVANLQYGIEFRTYQDQTITFLTMPYVWSGLLKAVVFSVIITMVCCYHGFITSGGSMGLGRSTMVAVVTSLVLVMIADAILAAFVANYII